MKKHAMQLGLVFALGAGSAALAGPISAPFVQQELDKLPLNAEAWKTAPEASISLMAQPIITPRPKTTGVPEIKVQAIHNGQWVAFKLSWADPERSDGGAQGKFSDAVALQFPGRLTNPPPVVFMGSKGDPVHILHWRAQYQVDRDQGLKQPKDFYPNMQIDMYPMEFNDAGHVVNLDQAARDVYSPGVATGNPQSYVKPRAVDEIIAEGFGSSTIAQNALAIGDGVWENGRWTVVISRPLARENGSILLEGASSWVAFAAWQGGRDEVGCRKSVTMGWTPLMLEAGK